MFGGIFFCPVAVRCLRFSMQFSPTSGNVWREHPSSFFLPGESFEEVSFFSLPRSSTLLEVGGPRFGDSPPFFYWFFFFGCLGGV